MAKYPERDPTHTAIGLRIRRKRNEKGYSQDQIARTVKLSKTAYNGIETGLTRKVDPTVYIRIAEAIDANPIQLIFGEDGQVFDHCSQSSNVASTINNNFPPEVSAMLQIIQQQMDVLNKQIALLFEKFKS